MENSICKKIIIGGITLAILLASLHLTASYTRAAPGDLLGTVTLPGNGNCNVAGTFDGTYYMVVQGTYGENCAGTVIGIYQPPAGGNGAATLVATKTVLDGDSNPITISALSWDPSRSKVWAAYANNVYLIDIGDPTASGNALATFQFQPGVGGFSVVDGLAYDINDDTLYHSPDINQNVYQFSLGTGANPPLGVLMNTVAPKNSSGEADGIVSGVAIGAGNTLYIGRDGNAEIRLVDKTTGAFISQFATTSGRTEDLVCDPITYSPLEAILSKDAYNGLYEAFEVEAGTCPIATACSGSCEPMTQGFWNRICDGATGEKEEHPATPNNFDQEMCSALLLKGKDRSDPCVRAEAQYEALLLNIHYGYLAPCCDVCDSEGNKITADEALNMVRSLIDSGGKNNCKDAEDLASAANNACNACGQ